MIAADVSVIVPCYNTERYLSAALTSVCQQVPPPAEVLVVDDGSTDESAMIAEAFGGPVRCIRREHRGISATRNTGLSEARGAFVAFLDADDLWTPNSLALRFARFGDPVIDCVSGLVEQFISPELPPAMQQALYCPSGAQRGRGAGTLLMRRPAADQIGFFDETLRVGEAMDWVARGDALGVVTVTVDEVVLRRRVHDANTGIQQRHHRGDYLRMLKHSIDRKRALEGGGPADV